MKSDVRQPSILQDLLVQVYDGVWVVHLAGCRRGEHVGILRVLAVFRYSRSTASCGIDTLLTEVSVLGRDKVSPRSGCTGSGAP